MEEEYYEYEPNPFTVHMIPVKQIFVLGGYICIYNYHDDGVQAKIL